MAVQELTEESSVAEPPSGARIQLKLHQLALLKRCMEFEREDIVLRTGGIMRTNVGILGDKVGSGKSFVMLALLLMQMEEKHRLAVNPTVRSHGLSKVTITIPASSSFVKTSMLVVPHNLCVQWEGYIASFCPDEFKCVVVRKHSQMVKLFEDDNVHSMDLLVVTNTFYNMFTSELRRRHIKLSRVIYDEADSLRVPGCICVDAVFSWFVTASYPNLLVPQGSHSYEYINGRREVVVNMMGIRNNGYVKGLFLDMQRTMDASVLVVKSADAFVRRSMNMVDYVMEMVRCKTPMSILVLNGVVDRNIIECLSAGDVSSAIQHVTNKNTEENIVGVLVHKLHMELHNLESTIEFMTTRMRYESDVARDQAIASTTKKKNDVMDKIQHIRTRVAETETCCICYDALSNKTVSPCCSNAYCFKCISLWVHRSHTCPLCKGALGQKDLMVVDNDAAATNVATTSSDADVEAPLDKVETLEKIVSAGLHSDADGERRKYLIFSSFENTFIKVTVMLDRLRIPYSFLKGNVNTVRSIVDRYKTGDLDVLLINTSHYGSGLNLENTTDIVMFHKFDSEIEKQVIGRAQRGGRANALKVWYLMYENEDGISQGTV